MSSIPSVYHRAGSAASRPFPPSHFVSAVSTVSCSSVSSGSSRNISSKIPKPKRLIASSDDDDNSDNHDALHITESREQKNQQHHAVDSSLIKEIKSLESYKDKAISAEKDLAEQREGNIKLKGEVNSLHNRLSEVEKEMPQLRQSLRSSELRLAKEQENSTTLQKRADDLASQVQTAEKVNGEREKELKRAEVQLDEERSRQAELKNTADNSKSQLEMCENEKLKLEQQLQSATQQLDELRSKNRRVVDERNESEIRCIGLSNSQRILEERCDQLNGLSETMGDFGAILEEIKNQQTTTNNRVLGLEVHREKERKQQNRDHLDIINQYSSHFSNMDELEREYRTRNGDLEGRIDMIEEGLRQSNRDSRERNDVLIAKLETITSLITKLPGQLDKPTENREHSVHYTIDQLRNEITEAIAAVTEMCSRLLINHELPREVQPECQESDPSISPLVAGFSIQGTGRGQTQIGLYRKRGHLKSQTALLTTQPMSSITPVNAP